MIDAIILQPVLLKLHERTRVDKADAKVHF